MKQNRLIRIISLSMLIVLFCAGQTPVRKDTITKTVRHNYLAGLQHHNSGVVESAIFQLIILKTVYPEGNYDDLAKELNQLMTNGKTATTRYKAFVAATYLSHPEWFPQILEYPVADRERFFLEFSEIIDTQLQMLGVNPHQ